ncbi:pinin [Drosophila willistoni]|uniref:pinin n=1 Tax=Drosophila willistoni TaxID=7260 RepID=UPI000C26C22F|nr:pinin [Drosophila willistoni]
MADEVKLGISSVGDLEAELTTAKQSLVSLNENIRRFVGRDIRTDKYKYEDDNKRSEFNNERQTPSTRNEFSKNKQRRLKINDAKSPFARPANEEVQTRGPTPRLNSRVIRELPSRKEVVEAQGTDSESRARNRRMFGSLLGTLQKFCQEETRLKTKEDKKAEIERKLEQQQLQERALLKKERESLFSDRKRKQLEIKQLETKMARLKDFKLWETATLQQKQQIRTKAKPHIFYRPQNHNEITERLLQKSSTEIDSLLQGRRDEFNAELRDLERSQYTDDENAMDESNADFEEFETESGSKQKCDKNAKENKIKASRDDNPLSMVAKK